MSDKRNGASAKDCQGQRPRFQNVFLLACSNRFSVVDGKMRATTTTDACASHKVDDGEFLVAVVLQLIQKMHAARRNSGPEGTGTAFSFFWSVVVTWSVRGVAMNLRLR